MKTDSSEETLTETVQKGQLQRQEEPVTATATVKNQKTKSLVSVL
jgi:hypothetical protein